MQGRLRLRTWPKKQLITALGTQLLLERERERDVVSPQGNHLVGPAGSFFSFLLTLYASGKPFGSPMSRLCLAPRCATTAFINTKIAQR